MIKPADSKLFFSKGDLSDRRLGDFAKHNIELSENTFAILGYPDEEGIRLNGGRLGASQAPDRIRNFLYRMTPSLNAFDLNIKDLGNLEITGPLNSRHDFAFETVKKTLATGARVITLGGGHDYGFPDFAAFIEDALLRRKKPVIVNFDAHLDVRPNSNGNNSGTPFYRLLEKYSEKIKFFEVGIQDWCNSSEHLKWAKSHGAGVITLNEIMVSGQKLCAFLSDKILSQLDRTSELGLSLDIDCFSSSLAPAASQVFPIGLDALELLLFWQTVNAQFKARLMGVYEVSPPLDLDDRTSRLAAIFVHQFLYA